MRGLGITLAALVGFAGIARADDAPLDQARHDVESSDYEAARTHLTAALAAGGANPDELAEIYKLTGVVEAALGNTSAAASAFAKWIALDPKAALPAGTSPKIVRPFDAAHKKPVKLELKTETSADPPTVTLVVASDPIGIVKVRVVVSADGKPELEHDGKARLAVELPRGKRLDLRVEALDTHGNRVAVFGSRDVPIVITGAEPDGAKPDHDRSDHDQVDRDRARRDHGLATHASRPEPLADTRPWYLQWRWWGVAAIATTVGTAVFAYETYSDVQDLDRLNASSLDHRFSAAQAIESNIRRDLLITDIGAGLTGALAIGTAILYLSRPHDERLRVTAAPTRGGGAVTIGGAF